MNILETERKFYIVDEENNEIAEITFTYAGEEILIIDHTYVSDKHRGKGYAEALVKRVVDMAIKKEIQVIPLCPFAASEFRKKPEYRSVQKK